MLTASSEDYLETILTISEEKGSVGVTDVARRLGLTKPSVTGAVSSLRDKELVIQERYGKIRLTEKGLLMAKKVRRRHLVLRSFLRDVLGVDNEQSEIDACQIEHVVSAETIEKIVAFMEERLISVDHNGDEKA